MGQPQKIEQVIINLIENACQALPDKSAAIRVVVYNDPDKRMNVIEVQDGGRGIDPDKMENIVEPFFTTKRNEGGSGLGLAVSDRIVKEHSGTLEMESAPGEGALFRVSLPTAQTEGLE